MLLPSRGRSQKLLIASPINSSWDAKSKLFNG